MVIELGSPLFDYLVERDVIWVYYPTERLENGWRCDLMTLCDGELFECRQGLCFSDRFLSSLYGEAPE